MGLLVHELAHHIDYVKHSYNGHFGWKFGNRYAHDACWLAIEADIHITYIWAQSEFGKLLAQSHYSELETRGVPYVHHNYWEMFCDARARDLAMYKGKALIPHQFHVAWIH